MGIIQPNPLDIQLSPAATAAPVVRVPGEWQLPPPIDPFAPGKHPGQQIDPFKNPPPPIDPFAPGKHPGQQINPFHWVPPHIIRYLPGGAPTATAKVPTKVVAKKKPPKKKGGGGGGRGTAGVTVSDVDTDASAGTPTSAAPTTAPPGSSIDPKWVLAQLKAIYGSGADPKKLAALASKLAAQAVQAQVAGITTQQQQLQQQGRSQALNILAASRAAANLQNNFGNVLNTAYGNAADETSKIAGGYAGQLQTLAQGEASQLQKQVEAAGGTYGEPVANLPQNAYNALYGLQGAIPATALNNQAVTSMKQAQSLPMITRGGGTQTALLAQGAANQASNALFKNIQDAKNKLPSLTQSYLNNLSSQDAANRKLKLAGLNTALAAMAKGDSTAFNNWATTQRLRQGDDRIQLSKDQFNQNGQYKNATLKIRAFEANNRVSTALASASAARIRANTAAKKAALAMGQSADKMGANLSKRIDALVKGVWTSPSYSGGRPQVGQLKEDPKTPEEALRILLLEFGTLAGTPGGRNLIISELAAAYGKRRIVYPPDGPKEGIEYGWDPKNPATYGNAYQVVDGVLYLADK